MFNKKHFLDSATTFVVQAQYARTLLHPCDITTAREIAHIVAQVSEACGAVRTNMPVLIESRFDWDCMNTDVLTHIFRFLQQKKDFAKVCRRFYCIYVEKFVRRIKIPIDNGVWCFSSALPPLSNVHVNFVKTPKITYTVLGNLHKFLFARRCTKMPSEVSERRMLCSHEGGAYCACVLIVPHITLEPVLTLPFETQYLSVVGWVDGVLDLTLDVAHEGWAMYSMFPVFRGLETLRITFTKRDHNLFGDSFYNFYRNLIDLYNTNKPKRVVFAPPLSHRMIVERESYPLPFVWEE